MKTKLEEIRCCHKCGRVVQCVSGPDGVFWIHGVSEALFGFRDHEPIPVPIEQSTNADVRCDFCNNPDPTWVIPQSQGTDIGLMLIGNNESRTVTLVDEEWAACDLCKAAVESASDPRTLAHWVLDQHVKFEHTPKEVMDDIRPHMVRDLAGMYGNLLRNMMPAVPIDEYDDWLEAQSE